MNRVEKYKAVQVPGWKELCLKSFMNVVTLLEQTTRPFMTGDKEETLIEKRDREISERDKIIQEQDDQI